MFGAKLLQSCSAFFSPMDCSPPGSSVFGILQPILERVVIPSSRESSQPRDQICISYVSCIGRQVLYHFRHLGSPFIILRFYSSCTSWPNNVFYSESFQVKIIRCFWWSCPFKCLQFRMWPQSVTDSCDLQASENDRSVFQFVPRPSLWVCLMSPPDRIQVERLHQGYSRSEAALKFNSIPSLVMFPLIVRLCQIVYQSCPLYLLFSSLELRDISQGGVLRLCKYPIYHWTICLPACMDSWFPTLFIGL